METLKHLLGLCGESHPNIYTFILVIVLIKVFLLFLTRSSRKSV